MDPEQHLSEFVAKYSQEIGEQLQAARQHLGALFPRGFELVYDNYNALAIGFSPTERASDVVVSVAAYPKWVALFFLKGAKLSDPDCVLRGKGSTVRSVRLQPISLLRSSPVSALLAVAQHDSESAFALAPPRKLIIKSVSTKQRPRLPSLTTPRGRHGRSKGERSGA